MRWLIGIDLTTRSNGALELGAWLVRHGSAQLVAVHVIDERIWGPQDVAAALRPSSEQALADVLSTVEVPRESLRSEVVIADSVPHGLARAAARHDCDGIVIGRIAPQAGRAIIRLGAVARRMLRELALPVMVVPPDLSATAIGDGPLLAGTDLGDSSRAAGTTAARLAREVARDLLLVHVDPSYTVVPDYIGGGAAILPRKPQHVHADLERWAAASQLEPRALRIADGDVVEHMIAEARREDSPMIVVGSRRLTLGERIFSSSVGSDLARFADRPVLVVPGP
jgi:nucleotide-binding universal stress UspA family protein